MKAMWVSTAMHDLLFRSQFELVLVEPAFAAKISEEKGSLICVRPKS
jgi:hypothetical protein